MRRALVGAAVAAFIIAVPVHLTDLHSVPMITQHVSIADAASATPASPPPATCNGHPENAQGYVTDGSPQCDDQHCEEAGQTTRQVVSCLVARRPQCRMWSHPMDRGTATACWAPEINAYPWSHQNMFDALYCESKGEEAAWTHGPYRGLLQDDHGTGNAINDFEHAFWVKWKGQGSSAWAATYGHYCAD